ncbi:sulfate permease [Solirubrobacter ginsenosidimutans]|uniref:Sulfate permease n=1 Tax=Solirubrobacter ginsenosidimutans TaxID=490573 RepID=A0A9X3MNB3_9ACTN|nr:sulfate permease [Solirubrobacter ginsenosidimutans]MDA0159280.1 sulfate permease [Solirubrobacter ginsenosidimutans]
MRWLPEWARGYDRAWLPVDVMAGLTIWALMVPQALAYAGIAGVPVQNGLYVMPLAAVGYALLGSSIRLFVGPSAGVATLSASTVAVVGSASTGSAEYIALTVALTLMVGVLYIAGGLARMGFVSRFFARPVLDGFIVGLGLYIAIGQLPKVVGIAKPSGDTLAVFVRTVTDIGSWEASTVAVGVIALLSLFALARFTPKLPGVIIVVAVAVLATKVFDLHDHGVAIVGDVPTGFAFVSLSSVTAGDLVDMLPGALAIVIVGLAQSLAIAKSYGTKHHEKVDANREMLGYGAANIGAGALQGFTVTGGPSASATAERVGAKSPPVAFLVSALMTLLTILFLAGLFTDLPEAVLGAIVIWAVSGMIDPSKLTQYWHARSLEFWAALGALLGVILINILPGVAIGVALSFIMLIHTIDHPHIAVLGRSRDGSRFVDLEDDPDATAIPGVLIHRFEAELIFANADLFQDDVLARVHAAQPQPSMVILDFEAIGHVDVTGGEALRSMHDTLDALGVRLIVARAKSNVRGALQRHGIADVLGEDNFAPTVDRALESGALTTR